jgi:hypothetical protein
VSEGADERRVLQSIDLGAAFLAALAYPANGDLRDAFAGAIICTAFASAPRGEDVAYEAVRLACLNQDRAKVETAIRRGVRIINEQRLEAAFAAWPQLLHDTKHLVFAPTARVPTRPLLPPSSSGGKWRRPTPSVAATRRPRPQTPTRRRLPAPCATSHPPTFKKLLPARGLRHE